MSARRAVGQALKVASSGADRIIPAAPGVVVLIYHRVGGASGSEVDLPAPLFEAQVAALAEMRCVVPLEDALAQLGRAAPADVPAGDAGDARPVVITFDDGTADFVDVALPILERHRMPVTLYAATSFIDEGRSFPGRGRPVSWAGLADARASGLVDVGSHTHRHLLLDRIPEDQVVEELDRSIDLIATHVGRPPADFAYPKAVMGSPEAQRAVRARFRSAAVAGTRPNPFGASDPYRLARSPIQVGDGMRFFSGKVAGGLRMEDAVRRLLNRRRYAGATT